MPIYKGVLTGGEIIAVLSGGHLLAAAFWG